MPECSPRLVDLMMGLIEPIILYCLEVDIAEETCQYGKVKSKKLFFFYSRRLLRVF